jgi:DNA repair exonuclease SbcCD ATPase subunit
VIRHLVAPGRGEEGHLIRRNVAYRDLILSPELNEGQRAGAIGLLDRLIKEGLLSADADPKQGLLISVPQEVMLRRWPGVWHWLSEDQHFFQMRDRLDASLKLWLSRGRQNDDLLDRGIGLGEAETLLKDFGSSLSEGQIEYIRKSLAKQKRRRWMRDGIGLAAIAGLVVFAAFAGIGRFSTESKRKNGKQGVPLAQQNTDLATSQRRALDTQLKKAQEEKAQLTQQNADLATSQRSALDTQLKKAEEKAQLAQQNTDLATSQRNALETELKKAQEEKAQLAQQNANLTSQSSALETQLKEAEEKAQIAQQNADLATSQRSALETELQNAQEEKARLELQNTNLTNQSSALETELKEAEEKAQIAQQSAELATSKRNALETELQKVREEKAQLELQNADLQQNADVTSNEPSTSKTQVKKAKGKRKLTQQHANPATHKRKVQQTQRKKALGKASRTKGRSTDAKTP